MNWEKWKKPPEKTSYLPVFSALFTSLNLFALSLIMPLTWWGMFPRVLLAGSAGIMASVAFKIFKNVREERRKLLS